MADTANKDEVDKCKRIAQAALDAGDGEKATRFLQKAKRMNPSDASIDQLLAKAAAGGGATPSNGAGSAPGGGAERPSAAAPNRAGPSRPTPSASTAGKGGDYTAEQMQLVQRMLRTKDYYQMLGVPRDSNEDAVKRAYKKLALKLHPDKNKAPGAEEAFKKLSKAVQCLTDADKKQVYDRYGDEDRVPQHHRAQYHQDFMTPEDLFSAFFGGHMGHPGGGHQHHHQGDAGQRAHLFQILPVVVLIVLTVASNLASNNSSSRFSFQASNTYRVERVTASLDVPYYVTDDFTDHYAEGTKNLAEFERQVEIYYVRNLHSECDYQEKTMYKKVMIAKRRGNQEDLKDARAHPRPACKHMEAIKKSHSRIYRAAMYMGSPYGGDL